jgi:hypothetical protein
MTQLPDEIAITWSYEDVQSEDPTLTDEEARQVLQLMKDGHDATIGINWDTINAWIDYWKSI